MMTIEPFVPTIGLCAATIQTRGEHERVERPNEPSNTA